MSTTRQKVGIALLTGVMVVTLILCIAGGSFLYLSFASHPSTKSIARRYLDAVISEDLQAAVRLARSKEECRQSLLEVAAQDIQEFGGDQVRNISIDLQYNDGSDDEIQFAVVQFEHRDSGQVDWQTVSMRLMTDHDVPGFRYLCGR